MDKKAIEAIKAILNRGNDVQIRKNGSGIIILEVKKEICYKTT